MIEEIELSTEEEKDYVLIDCKILLDILINIQPCFIAQKDNDETIKEMNNFFEKCMCIIYAMIEKIEKLRI